MKLLLMKETTQSAEQTGCVSVTVSVKAVATVSAKFGRSDRNIQGGWGDLFA